ncbi:glycosyltransferase family 39 protein [Microseira sp. BLCC-F43]|jgi:uncharacterized membrane protein|uniref:glycosyltransferase family 39 protein n=1 Tax=Microseira sp. BLCC-F43 TaxID=3153602 RepID=UPI0035B89795
MITQSTDNTGSKLINQWWNMPPFWWRGLIVILVILGIVLRFGSLDSKSYSHDEAYTSLRISGYTLQEVRDSVFDGRVIEVKELYKYQYPNSEKRFTDTIKGLAIEEAHLPPPYFLMARLWVQWFGNSVAVTRSLSAVFSLLAFPAVYWLCLELFDSQLVAWVALAIFSVSPFHILYAQDARFYSLFIVTILLASAALLRAMRLQTKFSWRTYAATVALGFYTVLFSFLVTGSHALYVAVVERFRFTKNLKAYLLASLAGFLTFVPWILAIVMNATQVAKTTGSAQNSSNIFVLLRSWILNLSRVFIDVEIGEITAPIVLILVGYSLYYLYRKAPEKVSVFIFTLIGVTAISLVLTDLILGWKLTTRSRYLITSYVGIQLAVAYLFASGIVAIKSSTQQLWKVAMALLISAELASCAVKILPEAGIRSASDYNIARSKIINKATRPLLVSSNNSLNPGDILAMSSLLEPKVKLQLVIEPNIPKIPDGFSDVFLYNTSSKIQTELGKKYKIKIVDERAKIWHMEKKIVKR